jgi:hypothetical protein
MENTTLALPSIGTTNDDKYIFQCRDPGYMAKALKFFQHVVRNEKDQPFPSVPIQYGAKKKYAKKNESI